MIYNAMALYRIIGTCLNSGVVHSAMTSWKKIASTRRCFRCNLGFLWKRDAVILRMVNCEYWNIVKFYTNELLSWRSGVGSHES